MCPFCSRTWKFCQKTIQIHPFNSQSQIHTTAIINGARQAANAMKKILGVNKKRKFVHYEGAPAFTPESFSKGSSDGRPSINSRRAAVLNKLFMKHVTDLMATGEYASEILGHGIEINRVKIAPDYKCLNIYWIARGSEDDQAVDQILQKNAGSLRHELSQLRVMGNVPMIQFVKDKRYARIVALEKRLAIADYGEDYVPSDEAVQMKSEFELYVPLEDETKRQEAELDEETPLDESDELPFPPMPQNVLGLDHAAILTRIRKQVKKSEAPHRHANLTDEADESWATFKLNQSINKDPVSLGSSKTQREAFREFLHQRQILKMKEKRRHKNYMPDVEYVKEEFRNAQFSKLEKFDDNFDQDDDFIDDVEEKV
nr:uncharacterized protein LOC111509289 [Leptinotarsa decemlineata]